jgi:hypothetical protein
MQQLTPFYAGNAVEIWIPRIGSRCSIKTVDRPNKLMQMCVRSIPSRRHFIGHFANCGVKDRYKPINSLLRLLKLSADRPTCPDDRITGRDTLVCNGLGLEIGQPINPGQFSGGAPNFMLQVVVCRFQQVCQVPGRLSEALAAPQRRARGCGLFLSLRLNVYPGDPLQPLFEPNRPYRIRSLP